MAGPVHVAALGGEGEHVRGLVLVAADAARAEQLPLLGHLVLNIRIVKQNVHQIEICCERRKAKVSCDLISWDEVTVLGQETGGGLVNILNALILGC